MKATRFNFYRDGMEPEKDGDWVRVDQLPRKVVEEFVEDRVSRGYSDDDEDRLAS
jgi:hypothetical protein